MANQDFRVKNGLQVGLGASVVGIVTAESFTGSGIGLTAVPSESLTGTISTERLSGTYNIDITGTMSGDSINVGTGNTGVFAKNDGTLLVTGIATFKDRVIFDSTNSIQIPVGTDGEKDNVGTAVTGQIRYNTTNSQFEGFGPGGQWGSLGGVKDVDGDTYIKSESSAAADEDALTFFTGGTERAVIDSNGNVGIATTNPTATLDLDGTLNVSGVSTFQNNVEIDSTGYLKIPVGLSTDRPTGTGVTLGQIRYNSELSQFEGYGAGNAWGSLGGIKDVDQDTYITAESSAGADEDALTFFTGGTEKAVIDSTGKVGIGSTQPTSTLDVDGTLNVSGISTFDSQVAIGTDIISNRGKISFPTTDGYLSRSLISAGNPVLDYGLYVVDSSSNANANLRQNYVRQTTSGNYSVSVGATEAFRVSNNNGTSSHTANPGGMLNNQVAFIVTPDTSTELRYNYSTKLETTTDGFKVLNGTSETAVISGPQNIILDPSPDDVVAIVEGDISAAGVSTITGITTTNIAVGNLIQEVDGVISAGTTVTSVGISSLTISNVSLGSATNQEFTFANQTPTGIVRVKGDLYIDGTRTEINSTTLTIDDLNVVVASGATNGLTADGAGLTVDGANAYLKYNYNAGTNETWELNKNVGIGTDNATAKLDVDGTLNVSGISTFGSDLDINASVDISTNLTVDGLTDLDELNVSGISTFSDDLIVGTATTGVVARTDGTLNVSGISTFLGNVNIGTAATTVDLPGLYLKGNSAEQNFITNPSISIGGTTAGNWYDTFLVDGPNLQYVRHWASNFDVNFSVPDDRIFVVSNTDGSSSVSPAGVVDGHIAFKINPETSTELRYNKVKKLETTGYGVTVSGGLNVSGISTFQDHVVIGAGKSIQIGPTGDQLSLEYDTNGIGLIRQNAELFLLSPSTQIGNLDGSKVSATFLPTHGVTLKYNNDDRLGTTDYGISVIGRVETSRLNVSGISTFASDLDINADVNVSGVVTARSFVGSGELLTNLDAYAAYTSDRSTLATIADKISGIATYSEDQGFNYLGGNESYHSGSFFYGIDVEASDDGKVMFVSSVPFYNNGNQSACGVQIYERTNSNFNYVGFVTSLSHHTLGAGQTVGDLGNFFGPTIASNADGSIFAVGSPNSVINTGSQYEFGVYSQANGWDGTTHGYVNIFQKTGSNIEPLGILTAPPADIDNSSASMYGHAVALNADGTKLYVSAIGIETNTYGLLGNNTPQNGLVYAYNKVGTSYQQVGVITSHRANDFALPGSSFGWDIACSDDGDTIYISGPTENIDGNYNGEGIVEVYSRTGNTFSHAGILTCGHDSTTDLIWQAAEFGINIDCSSDGNIVAIAAAPPHRPTQTPQGGGGALFVFEKTGTNTFTKIVEEVFDRHSITSNQSLEIGQFDLAVNSDASTIIMSASKLTNAPNNEPGGRFVAFSRDGGNIRRIGNFTSLAQQPAGASYNYMMFGSSFDIDSTGDNVFVGAPIHPLGSTSNSLADKGSAYVFNITRQIALHSNQVTGNIGIGTDNPTSSLDVNGTLNVSGITTVGKIVTDPTPLVGIATLAVFGESGENSQITIETEGNPGSRLPYVTSTDTLWLSPKNGHVKLTNRSGSQVSLDALAGAAVSMYYNNSKKLETTTNGIDVTGDLYVSGTGSGIKFDAYNSNTTVSANYKLRIQGTNSHYTLYGVEGGSSQYVKHKAENYDYNTSIDTGKTFSVSNNNTVDAVPDNEIAFKITPNASTELRYNYNKKLETTGYGVSVTDGLNVSGIATAQLFSGDGGSLTNLSAYDSYKSNISERAFKTDEISGVLSYALDGQRISGTSGDPDDRYGLKTTLSKDGKIAFVSQYVDDTQSHAGGTIHIYERTGANFTSIGIVTQTSHSSPGAAQTVEGFGPIVACNADATIFAVGSPQGIDAHGDNMSWWHVPDGPSDPHAQQSVQIFQRNGSTITNIGILTSPSPGTSSNGNDSFGASLAFSDDGSKLYVGSPFRQMATGKEGAVFAYDKSGLTYNHVGIITVTSSTLDGIYGGMGNSVECSSDGNTIFVGHPGARRLHLGSTDTVNDTKQAGTVEIYDRSGSTFTLVDDHIHGGYFTTGTKVDQPIGKGFGHVIACSDDGNYFYATSYDDSGQSEEYPYGKLHLFKRESNTYSEVDSSKLESPHSTNNRLGYSLACDSSGSRVIVGECDIQPGSSAVHYYVRVGDNITHVGFTTSVIETQGGIGSALWGFDLDLDGSGEVGIIGAPYTKYVGDAASVTGNIAFLEQSRGTSVYSDILTGNIGIKTDTPLVALDVAGAIRQELHTPAMPVGLNDDIGVNWTKVDTLLSGGTQIIGSLVYCGNGIVFAGGYNLSTSEIYKSTDFGQTWFEVYGTSLSYIHALVYCGNGIVLAGGGGGYSEGDVYRSTDFGLTWTKIEMGADLEDITSLVYCGNGIVLAGGGGDDGDGDVYRSTDFGLTWTKIEIEPGAPSPILNNIESFVYCGNGIVLAGGGRGVGEGDIYRSTDFGQTWVKIYDVTAFADLNALVYCGNGIVLAASGVSNSGGNGEIYRSTDFGLTWDMVYDTTDVEVLSLVYCDNGIVLAGTYEVGSNSGYIYKSTDFGLTWTKFEMDSNLETIYSLVYCGNGIVLAGGGTGVGDGSVYRSDVGFSQASTIQGIHHEHLTGNIGIGTTNPTTKLDVDGTLNVSGVSTFQDNIGIASEKYIEQIAGDNTTSVPHRVIRGYGGTGNFYREYAYSNVGGGTSAYYEKVEDGINYEIAVGNDSNFTIGNNSARPISGSNKSFEVDIDGATSFYYNHNKKLETTGYGVTVTGDLNVSGISTFQDDVNIGTGGTVAVFDVSSGNVGIGSAIPAYTLDLGESPSTIRLVSDDGGTAIRMGAGDQNHDFTMLRVDGATGQHDGESASQAYGFSLRYIGSLAGNNNKLRIVADNQTGTPINAFTMLQDGSVGINSINPTATLDVNGSVAIKNHSIVSITTSHTSTAGISSTIDTFAISANDLAEYTIHVGYGNTIQAQKVLVMHDGTTAYSQEYAVMYNPSKIVTIEASISGSNVLLQATPETGVSGITTYKIVKGGIS